MSRLIAVFKSLIIGNTGGTGGTVTPANAITDPTGGAAITDPSNGDYITQP